MNLDALRRLTASLRNEDGATMAEYAVIMAIVVVAAVAILGTLTGGLTTAINNVVNALT